ncbi:flagellar basal body-associated FliL family protein [Cereibacter azotoformans]|uniref:Flagellar protein FliL n=2 Tax=Cereibacter TaxID=1653176 RepID=A0A2T5KDF4_9RHOB|nr:flagellar basal body-associated FliL family protein [Cereibacter azotoformans]AXQ93667.1 flagellar basal body protein FliL [Cereibacter sphaeroides]MBO4168557.1 flagellar basal body-associated FliL family protein [Cereibacter azotoformans]PTR20453.1 flagellar FliL protein [Cereibacter azotoformans]UIJ32010.1 flagellar basal body-associated FliL family protein [Cereibacter azotoformans]ULB09843.1 flagellar basal body-associated FliL family protein [Cereibacter azotoformans]
MTDATATLDPKPRRGRGLLRMLGLLLLSVVLLALGFGAGFFYFANPLSPAKDVMRLIERTPADEETPAAIDPKAPQKVPRPTPNKEAFVTSYYQFKEPLTTNLRASRRFLQVGIGLSTQYDQKVMDNVARNEVALRSDMLAIIGTFSEEELQDKAGRDRLAEALRGAVNARLQQLEGFGGIEAVFFPSFILQ